MDADLQLTGEVLDHPALRHIDRVAREWFGIGFSVVFPEPDGWRSVLASSNRDVPVFCRLFLEHEEGRRRCKRFHAMAAMAACRKGRRIERCHAGAAVMVSPLIHVRGTAAVLGSCVFTPGTRVAAVRRTTRVAAELGLDPDRVRRTLAEVPNLSAEQVRQAEELLSLAAVIVEDLARRTRASEREGVDEKEVESGVISVVRAMVDRNPEVDYSVSDLARAAGITPNYFSALFRLHTGSTFIAYLQERRIALAKRLLLEPGRPSVAEVGMRAGFSDANYFIRCFRKQAGQPPLQWRRAQGV